MPSHPLLFCFAAATLIAAPGPNFLYVLTRAIAQGRRAALFAAVGLGCGVLLHTVLAVVGLSALIRSSYVAFRVVKYGGSAYLIVLGFRAIRGPSPFGVPASVSHADGAADVLGQSIVASMTNPKTIIFFISFLPQFVDRAAGRVASQLLVLGGLYMVLTVAIYGIVALTAGSIGRRLREHAAAAARMRWLTGGSFIGLGTWSALSETR